MSIDDDALTAERTFFTALTDGDTKSLNEVLSDDFVLIDVVGGSEIPKAALIELIREGRLKFESIDPEEGQIRTYGATAIVTGATRMKCRFDKDEASIHSRYTHVYIERDGQCRLVAAQGTKIAGDS